MPSEAVPGGPLTILLVEDNLLHAEIVKRTLQAHQIAHRLYQLMMGKQRWHTCFGMGSMLIRRRAPGHRWCC